MTQDRLHLLGIRHHGPGSAASVLAALDGITPAVVLIEGPPEANDIIAFAARPGMRPPIALLIHPADDAARAVFYPFAEFSPEWQAIHWALKHECAVRFIDLSALSRPTQPAEDEIAPQEGALLRHDPLSALAAAAGESDGESWWNALVEQAAHERGVFAAIEQAMSAVRESFEATRPSPPEEECREAHMRLEIGKALGESDGAVAVICGAWHVPALRRTVSARQDREKLKGLAKVKAVATWVPWTDTRLAALSGYGAGIVSPGWYRHLWHDLGTRERKVEPVPMAARWQAHVAALLRAEGLPAATASVIEAARLSVSLAALRGHPVPGLREMQDASLSALCHGDDILLRLIETRLVIGQEIGEIDDSVPQMPLAADLARWQKKLRLKPEATEQEVALDLRSETGLAKSALLHRLLLIDLPWGRLSEAQAGRGTFREIWHLLWQPEFSVKLAEALRFGTTIEQAAGNAALEAGEKEQGLKRCSELIGLALNADLPAVAEKLVARLQVLSVSAGDIAALMQAVPPLANILRYGTARRLPKEALENLITSLTAEIHAGFGPACRGLNEEAARTMFAAMQGFDGAVELLAEAHQRDSWLDALMRLEQDDQASAFLRGYALRRLYDRQRLAADRAAARLARALSPAIPVSEAGLWLEGFLAGAAQLLLHDARLFRIIDMFLAGLAEDAFIEMLPMLRRALGAFDQMERRRLLEAVKHGKTAGAGTVADREDDPRAAAAFAKALPLLKTILGLADE
ncbi:MAG: DUF5682 family protein [Pseudomonadota bacterium]